MLHTNASKQTFEEKRKLVERTLSSKNVRHAFREMEGEDCVNKAKEALRNAEFEAELEEADTLRLEEEIRKLEAEMEEEGGSESDADEDASDSGDSESTEESNEDEDEEGEEGEEEELEHDAENGHDRQTEEEETRGIIDWESEINSDQSTTTNLVEDLHTEEEGKEGRGVQETEEENREEREKTPEEATREKINEQHVEGEDREKKLLHNINVASQSVPEQTQEEHKPTEQLDREKSKDPTSPQTIAIPQANNNNKSDNSKIGSGSSSSGSRWWVGLLVAAVAAVIVAFAIKP